MFQILFSRPPPALGQAPAVRRSLFESLHSVLFVFRVRGVGSVGVEHDDVAPCASAVSAAGTARLL